MSFKTRSAAALAASLLLAPAAQAADTVKLRIRYDDGAGRVRIAHVTCTAKTQRADGYLRTIARSACRRARSQADFLAARPDPSRTCTEIFGGPQKARITGTIGDRKISRRFARSDGCALADWERARPLLPKTRGAAPPPPEAP